MTKLYYYEYKREEPAIPPRHLRRWFIQFDRFGQALTVLMVTLAAIGYSQISGLADGVVMAVLGRFWALWVLTVLVTNLLALDLTAEIYERTTGTAYRRRERALRDIAASAERDAVSAAEDAVHVRTRKLDERELSQVNCMNSGSCWLQAPVSSNPRIRLCVQVANAGLKKTGPQLRRRSRI